MPKPKTPEYVPVYKYARHHGLSDNAVYQMIYQKKFGPVGKNENSTNPVRMEKITREQYRIRLDAEPMDD